jgi:hypothetical protein
VGGCNSIDPFEDHESGVVKNHKRQNPNAKENSKAQAFFLLIGLLGFLWTLAFGIWGLS